MKNLFSLLNDSRNEDFAGFLFFSDSPENSRNQSPVEEEENNIERDIDKALKSPLGFGVKELRFLEKNEKEMSRFQKKRFRNIAGYQVSLAREKEIGELPPRMLTNLAESPLLKMLPRMMQKQILAEIDTQMKSLVNILSKSANDWTTFELSKVCVLYRRLRKNAIMKDGSRDGTFEDARKKIIQKTFQLMTKSISRGDRVYDAVKGKKNEVMTLEEKVLVMEVRRMFPNEKSWAEKNRFYDWDKIAVNTIAELFTEKKKASMLINPSMAFTWELLRDFLGENSQTGQADALKQQIIAKVGKGNLKKYFKATESIKFLQFAKNSRVFLPTHLQALQEIIKNEESEENSINKLLDIKDWEAFGEKSDEIKELDKKLEKLSEKESKYVGIGLENYIKAIESNDKVEESKIYKDWEKSGTVDLARIPAKIENYKTFGEKKDEAINDAWNNKFEIWVDSLKKAWTDEVIDKKVKDLELQKSKELAKLGESFENKKAIEENYDNKIKETTEEIPAKFDDFKNSINGTTSADDRKEKIEEFTDFVQDNSQDLKKTKAYKEFNTNHGKYSQIVRKWTDEQNKISRDLPLNESLKKERTKINEKRTKLKEEITEKTKNLDAYKLWGGILKNPAKIAKDARDDFARSLSIRIEENNLYAADFDVLWGPEMTDRYIIEDGVEIENPYYEDLAEFRKQLKDVPNIEKIAEFRGKFAIILEDILDGVTVPQLSESEDKFAPWYRELDNALSYENIISRLKEEGFDLRENFSRPQQITQLIDGAIRSFRDKIFEKVVPQFDELSADEEKEFYAGWDRLHGGLHGVTDPTEIHQKHLSYEKNKLSSSAKIENAHQVNQAYVEDLLKKSREATDPAKKEHYWNEAKKLERSFEYRKNAYQAGGNFWGKDENGNEKKFWAPGKELLNELDIQTQSVSKEISEITTELRNSLFTVAEKFRGISNNNDPLKSRLKQAEARRDLEEILGKWPRLRDKLQAKFADMGTIITEIIPGGVAPDEFVDEILKVPQKMLKSFDATFSDLEKAAKKVDFKFMGKEPFWKVFADNFLLLENSINFQNGRFAGDSEKLDKYLEESNKTLEFLTNLQFFDDESAEKEEFKNNFNEYKKSFEKNFKEYKESIRAVNSRLRNDLNKLKDQEFYDKYGLDKEYLEGVLNSHLETSLEFEEMSDKFLHPNFLKDWIYRYDNSPQDRAEAILEMGDFRNIEKHAKNAGDYANNIKKWIIEYDNNVNDSGTTKEYSKFSLYDLYATVKLAIEAHERYWNRDSAISSAKIGVSFFGENSDWGKYMKKKLEEGEEDSVKEFETQYGEVAGWDLQEALYKTNDQDEAKALIRLMLEKGFLQWDDPGLWKTLMRISGNASVFRIPDDENLSRLEIRNKVQNLCEFIWSKETFRDWDTSFAGKYKSAVENHAADFNRYEDDKGARTRILANMLKRWSKGDSTDVDPSRYECFISESFKNGKMNGQPDQRLYFMIMGVATKNPKTGKTLLSRDVFTRMNSDYLARFPHIDWLTDKKSWKLDGRIVPEGTPGAEPRGWTFDDYQKWGDIMSTGDGTFDPGDPYVEDKVKAFFFEIVHMSPIARGRVARMNRSVSSEGDHDDAETFFADWNQQFVIDNLSKASGGENKASNDLWRSYLSGFPKYMHYMKKYIIEGDGKWGEMEGWKKERNRVLIEIGDRLKTVMTVLQTIQGNGNMGQSRGSLVFDRENWRDSSGMGVPAEGSRKIVNSFMRQVFKEAGTGEEEFGELLDFKGAVEYGLDEDTRKRKLKERGISDKMKKLLGSSESAKNFYENTHVIEKVLMTWTPDSAGKMIDVDFGSSDLGMAA